jgi:PAS domain S-box-containing protein
MAKETETGKTLAEMTALRARLAEAEETLRAISSGEVDALVISGDRGKRIQLIDAGDYVYRQFIEMANEGTAIVSTGGVILSCNASLAQTLRRPLGGVLGGDIRDYLLPEDHKTFDSILREAGTESSRQIVRLMPGGGVPVPVYILATRLESAEADPAFCLLFTDLQEVISTESTLRESEHLYRELLDLAPVGIAVLRQEKVVFVNPAGTHLIGAVSEDQIVGKSIAEIIHPDGIENARAQIEGMMSGESATYSTEDIFLRLDGTPIDVEILATPVKYGGEFAVQVIFTDITNRKRDNAERVLLMAAIEQAVETVIITDPEGTIQYVNPAFETLTGYTRAETVGKNPRLLRSGEQSPEFYSELWQTISSGKTWRGSFVNKRKDGKPYTVESAISPVRGPDGTIMNYVEVNHDVGTQQLLEERLHEAQKMETVGQLAGGVAHDFNNMLQVIITYTDMSLASVDAGTNLHKYLFEIRRAAQRSAEITGQLLVFARKQKVTPKVIDLNEAVAGAQKMIQRLVDESIDVAWLPGRNPSKVNIDPTQLDQILANLAVNARDAIGGVGRLTIGTQDVVLDADLCAAIPGSSPGEYVLLSVSDDGCGMTRQTLAHLFEPFFTTKEPTKGTGLGLSTVYGIVKQNNGFITVYSEVGDGTTFKLYLPRVEKVIHDDAVEVEPEFNSGGMETILVVEDEEAILELTRQSLQHLGYTVLAAGLPEEAIRMSQEESGPIHVLITDVVMPQMNGRQLAERLIALRPTLKCLYMSGYTADVMGHRGILEDEMDFIPKPFSLMVLAEKVREVLNK